MAEISLKWVLKENTVGKGEIAHYEQFLHFPQCFQKTCTADTRKPGLVWERVKHLEKYCTYLLTSVGCCPFILCSGRSFCLLISDIYSI